MFGWLTLIDKTQLYSFTKLGKTTNGESLSTAFIYTGLIYQLHKF